MKVEEARKILERPKFGDPLCIEARQRLLDHEEEKRLRVILIGKILQCIMCGYRGDKTCPMCKGAGEHTIDKQMAESWDLYALETVMEELRG